MFYERFIRACEVRNIAPTTAIRSLDCSSGMMKSWRDGGRPRADIVARMSVLLDVSADYLLELTDVMERRAPQEAVLEESERALIDALRSADDVLRQAALRSVNAILSVPAHNVTARSRRADSDRIRYFEKRVEGEAAAGAPIAAVPQDDMTVSVPEKYLDERYFIVRARGNSMIDAGIRSGSCCVFARDAYVDSGVIALVQVEGPTDQPEGTIKRVYFSGDRVELRPENPEYQSMFYPADAVRVSGVLVKVLE